MISAFKVTMFFMESKGNGLNGQRRQIFHKRGFPGVVDRCVAELRLKIFFKYVRRQCGGIRFPNEHVYLKLSFLVKYGLWCQYPVFLSQRPFDGTAKLAV